MRRRSILLCVSYLALIANSTIGAPQFAVHRVGPLNPNFHADRPDSISTSSALFAPIGVLQDGPLDNDLGDILIYTTERFVNGSGNLGMEYTQVATNGRQIWNLDTGNDELVGGGFGGTEYDGHFYFTSDYKGLQKSDGVHSVPFLSTGAGPPFLGQGGVFKFQDRLLYTGTYQEDEFAPTHRGLFDATSGVAALLFDMFPNGQPFDIPNHRVVVVNDEILISGNGVGNMYRIQRDASNWSIQTVQFSSAPVQASLFTPLGSKVVFTNRGADGFEPHILQGSVAAQIADINPGPASANPFSLTPFGDKVVFSALGPSGREPYITDGVTVQLLADLLPGSGDSDPRLFTVAGDRIYFSAIGAEGRQLYSSDGVDVVQVSHFADQPLDLATFQPLQAVGDRLYFPYIDSSGLTLYAVDGQSLVEIPGIPDGFFNYTGLVEFGGMHYFSLGFNGGTIYRTDGITAQPVTDGLPGSPAYIEGRLTPLNGSLLFTGGDVDDWALYRLDIVPEPVSYLLVSISLAAFAPCRARRRIHST